MSECTDCRRILPADEPLRNGRCRICARLPDWRVKGAAATPSYRVHVHHYPENCTRCKAALKGRKHNWCKACYRKWLKGYMPTLLAKRREERAERRAAAKQAMRGVDIDRIHYKLGALRKVKKAA